MADRNAVPWLDALAQALAGDGRAVLAVVADARGSTPRDAGAAMVVSRTGCAGTIGGGDLEFEATRIARDALAADPPPGNWIVRYPRAARGTRNCGGAATLAFSRLDRSACAWVDAAIACARTGAPFAIVARAVGAGDTTRLVVTSDDVRGTLGSVALDSAAIGLARTRLAGGRTGAALVRSAHDHEAPLLIQIERPDAFAVLLFGNGHVGRALANVLGVLPACVRWIDAREADFPASVPGNVTVVTTDAPEGELREAPAGAYVVITTHSHQLDFALVEAALMRDDWRYLGMIGSTAKRAQMDRRLADRGFPAAAIARVRCPIGADGVAIRAKDPGAIAVAVAAELLVVHDAARVADRPRRLATIPTH
jgi:xanthine dehydrogenase accessory factor